MLSPVATMHLRVRFGSSEMRQQKPLPVYYNFIRTVTIPRTYSYKEKYLPFRCVPDRESQTP